MSWCAYFLPYSLYETLKINCISDTLNKVNSIIDVKLQKQFNNVSYAAISIYEM